MKRILTITAVLLALVSAFICAHSKPAQAQLILASGTYRVVELQPKNERIGIAKLNANPTVVQNWVYVKINTKVTKRFFQNGWQRDENVEPTDIFSVIEKGDIIKVNGGRDWGGAINAKDILILPDNVHSWDEEN